LEIGKAQFRVLAIEASLGGYRVGVLPGKLLCFPYRRILKLLLATTTIGLAACNILRRDFPHLTTSLSHGGPFPLHEQLNANQRLELGQLEAEATRGRWTEQYFVIRQNAGLLGSPGVPPIYSDVFTRSIQTLPLYASNNGTEHEREGVTV